MKGIMFQPEIWEAKQRVLKEYGEAQTRRLIKPQPQEEDDLEFGHYHPTMIDKDGEQYPGDEIIGLYTTNGEYGWKPRYQVGEVVYVKEAWASYGVWDDCKPSLIPESAPIWYYLDGNHWADKVSEGAGKLRSPLFMPAWAARSFIQPTAVRAELFYLDKITPHDFELEGGEVAVPRLKLLDGKWVFCYTFKEATI